MSLLYFSAEQTKQIRDSLPQYGFQQAQIESDSHEEWANSQCDVKLTPDRTHTQWKIEVKFPESDQRWHSLQEVCTARRNWDEFGTSSPIELATLPGRPGTRDAQAPWRAAPGTWLYRKTSKWALGVKVFLQMIIGIIAACDVSMNFAHAIISSRHGSPLSPIDTSSIHVIAYALAGSAAIELAYTLYTPGPDEALDPLMLGLSSGILVLITRSDLSPAVQYSGVLIGVISLAGLFLIRQHLYKNGED